MTHTEIVVDHDVCDHLTLVGRFGAERGFLRGLAPEEAAARASELRAATAEVAGRLLLARVDHTIAAGSETSSAGDT